MNKLSTLLLISFGLFACSEDDAQNGFNEGSVLVLNEGNFLAGNGSIDAYDINNNQTQNGLYQANATIQVARKFQDNIYVITNGPDRLDILNEEVSLQASINQGFDNPIDFAMVGDRGYVTNWGDINTAFSDDPDSYVAIVDLNTNQVIDSVMLEVRPQRIAAWNGQLYIANEGSNTISVLDPQDLSMEEVMVEAGPSNLVVDPQGSLWVLCTSGTLVEINTDDLSVGTSIDSLTTAGFNEKMALDSQSQLLYFLGGNNVSFTGLTTVYVADLVTTEVRPLIVTGFALYGIGVHQESGDFYIGDSNAFQSTGTAFRFDAQGNQLEQFNTGIGPNGFIFK